MFYFLLKAFLIYATSWILWRVFRRVFVKSPLHHLSGPLPASPITGSLKQLFSADGIPWHHAMVKKYGRAFKIRGLLGKELLYVTDPRALHHILVKDQYVYDETARFIEGNKLVFGDGLLATLGDHHKKQRKMLNPVFSTANMRNLVPMFYRITYQLRAVMSKNLQDGPAELDMLKWMSRAALEYIGQGGLGYSFQTLEEDGENEYSRAVKELFPLTFSFAIYRQFLPFFVKLGTRQMRRRIVEMLPHAKVQKLIKIVDIMDKTSRQVFESKKEALARGDEALESQMGQGKDIMSVLLKANALADKEDKLPDSELLGQMNTLIFAGYDTTSSSLARMLHILALEPTWQATLRQEALNARAEHAGNDLTYDELMALPYLDAFVRESLRLHAPFTTMNRIARKDIILPLGVPVTAIDGLTPITSLHIPKGTGIIMGLAAANRDPAVWGEDADEFKPERWIGSQPDEVAKEKLPGIYSGTMTFLGGGRSCIGLKFSLIEIKIVLSMLLESFAFELSKEIVWKNGSIATPVTKEHEHSPPQLPLKVSFVKPTSL